MKTLKYLVVGSWVFVVLLEIIILFASQQQELPVIRHDRMATIPILLFLTVYYFFRRRSDISTK